MADNQRVFPVDKVVIHHSTGPDMDNWDDIDVQDWFDRIGAGRGYKGIARSYHQHPQRTKDTFSQAHYCLHRYTKDNNPYGWKLTTLIKDPLNNVAWHAGNWQINQTSFGVETAGNFLSQELPEKACLLIADYFREHDKGIGGKLKYHYHSQFSATACPGRIKERISLIVDMANNPDKYNYLKEDPKMIQELQNQIQTLKAEDATEDADFQKQIEAAQNTILSLSSLKQENTELRKENGELKQRITDLELSIDQKIKQAVNSAVSVVIAEYNQKLDAKDIEIKGLNEAIQKMHTDASTVIIPHENAFNKLEKVLTGKFTWQEKTKMLGQDLLYVLQNSLGGAGFSFGSIEVTNQMFGVLGANYDWWIKVIVIVGLFAIGYNATKSISKNILTKNNYTIAKAIVTQAKPDLKDEADVLEYRLNENGVLQ